MQDGWTWRLNLLIVDNCENGDFVTHFPFKMRLPLTEHSGDLVVLHTRRVMSDTSTVKLFGVIHIGLAASLIQFLDSRMREASYISYSIISKGTVVQLDKIHHIVDQMSPLCQPHSESREHLARFNLACELVKVIRRFFPEFLSLLKWVEDPRHQSYIIYSNHVLLMTRILSSRYVSTGTAYM